MKLNSLRDVFEDCVKDLYSAETQMLRALPKMARAASSEELRLALEEHLEQTRGQVERLERVCELTGIKPKGKTCVAMKGLIEEGQEILGAAERGDPAAADAAMIGAAQKIEHYEIAGYGMARTFARVLGEEEAAELLQETLDEEAAADERLTQVAESGLNQEAAEEDVEEVVVARSSRSGGRSARGGGRGANPRKSR